MKFLKLFSLVLACSMLFISCKKVFDYTARPSYGSLQSVSGECLPKTIKGIFKNGITLTSDNYIDVMVNIDSVGTYLIETDVVNGYSFKGEGVLGYKGENRIRLYGQGRPLSGGVDNFVIQYSGTSCVVSVPVDGAVVPPATFTLENASGVCSGAVVNGTYATGLPLSTTNTVTVSVNVTTIGVYSITTSAVNGISFSKSGSFTATGVQNITLIGNGAPTAAGANNYTVTAGASTCTFSVTASTISAAVFTLGGAGSTCTGASSAGTYTAGTALTVANTLTVQVNVTTAGTYTISSNTVNGFSFSKTGVFAATGTQTVELTGTGTPITAGAFSYTVSAGGGNCTFGITTGGGVTPPTADCKACGYQPWCNGSTYSNQSTYLGGTPTTVNSTISIVKDTTIDGKVFKKTNSAPGTPPIYYNCTNGVSTLIAYNVTTVSGAVTVSKVEQTLLKANEAVGASWTNTLVTTTPDPSITQTTTYAWSIGDKGISRTVQGVTYNDVIRVHMVLSATLTGFDPIVSGESDYYYAQGVGLIEQITINSFTGLTDLHQELKSYFIP